jgi:GT2 family glycosyltransferase
MMADQTYPGLVSETATAEGGRVASETRVTVVFLLHNAADAVADLVAAIGRQQPPEGASPARWAEVIFLDDASKDATLETINAELATAKLSIPARVISNESNLGLSRSLNRALQTIETDYVLTCHEDCRFGLDDYVARVVDLFDRNPDVAAVSGQPIADVERGLSQPEKVYLAVNLMDVFPDGSGELEPVGFAEGRCDGFRMKVLRDIGFYDTTVRLAGEDQLLAARIRGAGYRVCRAPALRYSLSVSSSQDSLPKLVRRAYLFGRVYPYLLLTNRGTFSGVVGGKAGRNRTLRTTLRVLQLASAGAWMGVAATSVSRRHRVPAITAVAATNLLKAPLFARYVRYLQFNGRDLAALAVLQPPLDAAYAAGVLRGLWQLARRNVHTIT